MRIHILSMQEINNYGSVLQAYSLKKMLNECGNEAAFLGISTREEEKAMIAGSVKVFTDEHKYDKSFIQKLFNMDDKSILNGVKKAIKKKHQKKIIDAFRNSKLPRADAKDRCDAVVIGSDEVFNCLQNTTWGYTSQLFGNIKNTKEVITYAASCGSATFEELPSAVRDSASKALNNVSKISVRDRGTAEFIDKLTKRPVVFHLDPVAVGDFNEEIENCEKVFGYRYCLVYSYNNRISNPEIIAAIKSYAEKNGLELVSVFGIQKWIPKHLVLSPIEVLKAFKNAECVVSDTFHGAVISSKFSKRLGIIIQGSNSNKLSDYMQRLHLEDHIITKADEVCQILSYDVNRDEIDRLLSAERERTLEYLKSI